MDNNVKIRMSSKILKDMNLDSIEMEEDNKRESFDIIENYIIAKGRYYWLIFKNVIERRKESNEFYDSEIVFINIDGEWYKTILTDIRGDVIGSYYTSRFKIIQ